MPPAAKREPRGSMDGVCVCVRGEKKRVDAEFPLEGCYKRYNIHVEPLR